jgi:hypothetical protein
LPVTQVRKANQAQIEKSFINLWSFWSECGERKAMFDVGREQQRQPSVGLSVS